MTVIWICEVSSGLSAETRGAEVGDGDVEAELLDDGAEHGLAAATAG